MGPAVRCKRLTLTVLVVTLLTGLTSIVAQADVTGSFDVDIGLIPEGTQTEAAKFFVNVRSKLQVNVALSGLTLAVDTGFGTTGVEFVILRLGTTLGALAASDTFVFATPFYNTSSTDPITAEEIHPTRSPGSTTNNGPSFVKQRLTLTLNVAGLTLGHLVIFEDVDFPNPLKYINLTYNANGMDAVVDTGGRGLANQTPSFGLGDVITVEGQTLGGVTIGSSTGICVRLEHNVIKGRNWPESVDPACGTRSPLLFGFERVRVDNVKLGKATLNGELFWRPSTTLAKGALSFNVFNKADMVLTLGSNNVTQLKLDAVRVDVTSGSLRFSAFDFNGDLSFDLVQTALDVTLNPKRSPASLRLAGSTVTGRGLVFGEVALSVKKDVFTYTLATVFDTAAGGTGVSWGHTRFDLSAKVGTVNVELKSTVSASGLRRAALKFGLIF